MENLPTPRSRAHVFSLTNQLQVCECDGVKNSIAFACLAFQTRPEVIREYEPEATDKSWEKDCGQGRDEWGNLLWGGDKSFNWNTQMCEEREPCGPDFIKQWGINGEICMGLGKQLLCNHDEMMAHQWSHNTATAGGEGQRITCLRKTLRNEVTREPHQFHKHENVAENMEYAEDNMKAMYENSVTGMNYEGSMEGKAEIETDYLNDEHHMHDVTKEEHAPTTAGETYETSDMAVIDEYKEEMYDTLEADGTDMYYNYDDGTNADYYYTDSTYEPTTDYQYTTDNDYTTEYTDSTYEPTTDYQYTDSTYEPTTDLATHEDSTYEPMMAGTAGGFAKKHRKRAARKNRGKYGKN